MERRKNLKKRILSIVLAVCMMSFFSVPFFAAEKVDLVIQPQTVVLNQLCVGYSDPSGFDVTIVNNGSGEITVEEPSITNQDTYFKIGSLSKSVLLPGETAEFSIAPKIGLDADSYQQELYVNVGSYSFAFTASIVINSHEAVYFQPKESTCTENGYEGYWYCGNCGRRFSDSQCTDEVNSDDIVKESEGHSWESFYTVDTEPTCTSTGEKSIHCSKCGERMDIQEIPELQHQYGDWVVIKEAACTEDGLMEKTCTECGDVLESSISATGHYWEIAEMEEVTEDLSNPEKVVKVICGTCGEEKYREDTEECQHQFGDWQTLIEPTCSKSGCEERQCQLCGYCESHIIDSLPHNWESEYTVDIEADCCSEGLKSIHCADCNAVKDETVVPKTSHSFGEWTESSDGSEVYRTCLVCGGTETAENSEETSELAESESLNQEDLGCESESETETESEADDETEAEEISQSDAENETSYGEEAEITDVEDQQDNTNVLLATFTTVITNTENARINMSVASAACNDSVILPGETWSFSGCTGDSNLPSNGYVLANVIANGEYTQGYGGGICQVSSTIYKAAVCANLEIVERHYHYWASDYTKAGFDATINYGSLDLKLRNTTDYPVYLKCYTDGNTVTASFYGWKDPSYDDIVTYSYNYDSEDGYFGTESYRVYIKDGEEMYRERLPGSKYKLDEYHDVWIPDDGTICADNDQPERSFPVAKEPEDIQY